MISTIPLVLGLLGPGQAPGAPEPLPPAMIRLDFEARTLAEIVATLNDQTPFPVILPEPGERFPGAVGRPARPRPPQQRLSVHAPEPLPFWEAIDRIGAASRHGIEMVNAPGVDGHQSGHAVALVPIGPERGFVCNRGVFRVSLGGLAETREVRYAPPFFPLPDEAGQPAGADPVRSAVLSTSLAILVEPRFELRRPIELTILEALDDRDRSLVRPDTPRGGRVGVYAEGINSVSVPLVLDAPDDPCHSIKSLRGVVSVEVAPGEPGSKAIVAEVPFDFADIPAP